MDGLTVDSFIIASNARGLVFDLSLDIGKVLELAAGNVIELSPFALACDTGWCMGNVSFVMFGLVVALAGDVDELENKWSSCDYAASSRKEVSANDVFEDRRFSRGLGADDDLYRANASASGTPEKYASLK